MQATFVAYLVMVLFVPLSAAVFAVARPPLAAAIVMLTASLVLPEHVGVDLPGLPPIEKYGLGSLCALTGACFTAWGRLRTSRPGRGVDLFALLLLLGLVGTSATNHDVLVYGPTVLPALTGYDAMSAAVRALFFWVVPFYLGRTLYQTESDLRVLLGALVAAMLLYSPLVLYELRMSPQLHRVIYGFHQHDFIQSVRESGYRPMVFVYHGLVLAMFLLTAALAAAGLVRARAPQPWGVPGGLAVAGLTGLLVAVKSAGALAFGVLLIPATLVLGARTLARVVRGLALLVLAFPLLRATSVFPTQALVDLAARVSQARASSLAFRFANEDALVAKAAERWLFGWGGFGRNRIFADWGGDVSVTDGFWIIQLGSAGTVGFVAVFGLLVTPVWMAARRLRHLPRGPAQSMLAALGVIVAVSIVDLLPNGLNATLPLLLAGALAGVSRGLGEAAEATP